MFVWLTTPAGGYGGFDPFYAISELRRSVQQQIEYYFSEENLARDVFLRGKIGEDGTLAIDLICSFKRLSQLVQSLPFPQRLPFILESLSDSLILELMDNKTRVRRRVFVPVVLSVDAPSFVPGLVLVPAAVAVTEPAVASPSKDTEALATPATVTPLAPVDLPATAILPADVVSPFVVVLPAVDSTTQAAPIAPSSPISPGGVPLPILARPKLVP